VNSWTYAVWDINVTVGETQYIAGEQSGWDGVTPNYEVGCNNINNEYPVTIGDVVSISPGEGTEVGDDSYFNQYVPGGGGDTPDPLIAGSISSYDHDATSIMSIMWDNCSGGTDPVVATLYYRIKGGTWLTVGNVYSGYTLTGLLPNTTYELFIRFEDAASTPQSADSNTITVKMLGVAGATRITHLTLNLSLEL
jgi:hypothetical protein